MQGALFSVGAVTINTANMLYLLPRKSARGCSGGYEIVAKMTSGDEVILVQGIGTAAEIIAISKEISESIDSNNDSYVDLDDIKGLLDKKSHLLPTEESLCGL